MRGAKRKLWTPDKEFFWSRVRRDGLWNRWCGDSGYGHVRHGSRLLSRSLATLTAHRVAWELTYGKIPNGQLVLHKCDVRSCVRPDHLFLGDDQDNMDDMFRKGRGYKSYGERQHLSKLTEHDVRIIRRECAKMLKPEYGALAKRFDVSTAAIGFVARRKTWKHVL